MTLSLSTISELERLYGEATKAAPKFQHKPGGLRGGLTPKEHAAIDNWREQVVEARHALVEAVPALLASARYVHELAAMGSSGCSSDLAAVLERARQIVGEELIA